MDSLIPRASDPGPSENQAKVWINRFKTKLHLAPISPFPHATTHDNLPDVLLASQLN